MSDIKLYSPGGAILAFRKCTTVELCLNSDTPALSEIKKEVGDDKVLALISAWIVDINEFFNVTNSMNPNQIKETSMFLLQDFYYFKIADINLIFINAKKGKFGNLYGSLDGSKIYKWFEQHDNDRANACYQEKLQEHDIIKERRY